MKNSRGGSDLKAQPMESSGPHYTQSAMKFMKGGTKLNSHKIRLRNINTTGFPRQALAMVSPKCSSMA